jgi:tagatose 6-phosphate kinase
MTTATYDLLVVGANPAMDRYYCLGNLHIGEVNRVSSVQSAAGGKANNLARVFRNLGGNPLTTGIAAGQTGRQILDDLTVEGIGHDYVFAEGESRQTVTVSAESQTTVLLEPGPLVSEEAIASLVAKVAALALPAAAVAITGSLPAGAPVDTVGRLVAASRETSTAMVAVDTSGEALRLAALAGPHVIKVNREEYERAFGEPTDRLKDVEAHFEVLTMHGVETLCLTDGPRGALVLNRNDRFAVRTPASDPHSTAGAGDAFLAGFVFALLHGRKLRDAARFASAVGAAALRHVAAGFVELADVDSALARTELLEGDAFAGAAT